MGSMKGLVNFAGKPLIEYAIEALKPHCDQILISANAEEYAQFGYSVIQDEIQDSGPMGGIFSCLRHSSNQLNFVLSCDMPLIGQKPVGEIIRRAGDFDATVPWHGNDFFEPLCAVYNKRLLPVFGQFIASGNLKIPDLLEQVKTRKIKTGPAGALDAELFYNVNTQQDLEKLESQLKGFENPSDLAKEKSPEVSQNLPLQSYPNLLLIAGTGRKVGKTTLACNLISQAAKVHSVTAIKISPHLHHQASGQDVIVRNKHFMIIREHSRVNSKDSSRMLQAGANQVYYLQTIDRHIAEPFNILMQMISDQTPVICESGALLNRVRPGLFLLVRRQGQTSYKKGIDRLRYKPDQVMTFNGNAYNPDPDLILFCENGWKIT